MKKIIIYLFLSFLILTCSNSKKNIIKNDTSKIEEKTAVTKDVEITDNKEIIENEISDIKETIDNEKTAAINDKTVEVENKKEIVISNNNTEIKTETIKEVVSIKKEETTTNSKTTEVKVEEAETEVEAEENKETIIKKPKISIDESLRTFVNKERNITGNWSLKQEGENIYIVFHSNFKTKSGPDLKVFISKQNINNTNGKNANENAVLLKDLSSNKGEQKYLIPSNIDLSQFKCILIHCVKYSKLWGGGKL